jgi:serine/threonine-protein kinase SRPK3
MLRLNPDKRARASDLVHHRWLDGIVVQGEIDVVRRAEEEEARRMLLENKNGSGSGPASASGEGEDALKPIWDPALASTAVSRSGSTTSLVGMVAAATASGTTSPHPPYQAHHGIPTLSNAPSISRAAAAAAAKEQVAAAVAGGSSGSLVPSNVAGGSHDRMVTTSVVSAPTSPKRRSQSNTGREPQH